MATLIQPDALKGYRTGKNWSQNKLADMTTGHHKVGVATIKRIEGTKGGPYSAEDRVAHGLARALGVKVEELSKLPSASGEAEETLRKFGYRPLPRMMIDADTSFAFKMVQHLYGIPVKSQIEMAPLFAALLAEGSLAMRRRHVKAIEETTSKLQSLGGGNYNFVHSTYHVDDGVEEERESIAKRDIFGAVGLETAFRFGYDPSRNNPFADYLKKFLEETGTELISLADDSGWKTIEGMPHYEVGKEILENLTGSDWYAKYALLRGHVQLKDIPTELRADEKKDERVAWLIRTIPDEELAAEKANLAELDGLLGLNVLDVHGPAMDKPEGDGHA
jgi:transcriptional regulator with XRE-family HTH domain